MVTNQALNKARKEREDEMSETDSKFKTMYREVIGALLYLSNATRPDISYAVNVLSRHQLNLTEFEWTMIKRIFRYLIGTRDFVLCYKGSGGGLISYADANFADCKNSLTTCGYVIRVYGDTIAWRTHNQSYVTLSTCQAEYVSMSEACQELVSLSKSINLMIDKSFYPMKVWCDKKAAEASAKTDGGSRLRHMMEVKEHYVKECVKRNLDEIGLAPSKEQITDIFTKPLSFEIDKRLTSIILNISQIS